MMSSVRWPSEMAHWTIHKGAGLPSPDFDHNFQNTEMEQIQRDYVRARVAGKTLREGPNAKAVDFLISVGREIHHYIESLKTLENPQSAREKLRETLEKLAHDQQALLVRNDYAKDLHIPLQLETATKVIEVFKRAVYKRLPEIFVERRQAIEIIESFRKEIRDLETEYFQRVSEPSAKLKEKIGFAKKCLVGNEKGCKILSIVVQDVTRFMSVFSSKACFASIVDLPRFLDRLDGNVLFIDRDLKSSDNVSLKLKLDQAKQLLVDLREIAILRNSYQEKIGEFHKIKNANKDYLESTQLKRVERDVFKQMLDIQVNVDYEDDMLFFGDLELDDEDSSPVGFPINPSPDLLLFESAKKV